MSYLKSLSDNIKSEKDLYIFTKQERVIRRTLGLQHLHKQMSDIIRSHVSEERKSNVKAQMTNWFLHQEYGNIITQVCEQIIGIASSLSDRKLKYTTYDCWGAIYKSNDYTVTHTHWPALWSWCYYIQVPENSPPLVFPQAKLKVFPKKDEVIIFPGHVQHEVPKCTDMQGERIILAGNIYLS